MSLVLTKPPRISVSKTDYGDRKMYTLHTNPNKIFAWRLDDTRMKTATVAFKRRQDADFMAHMIESHVLREKEWPNVSIVDHTFKLYGKGRIAHPYESDLIEVRSWNNMDDLRIYCARWYFDLVTLNSITKHPEGKFKLNGELVSLSVPLEFYTDHLEVLYQMSLLKEDLKDDIQD